MALKALLLLALATLAAAGELKIETLTGGDCSRKAKNGDTLSMHYKGTLADGGSEFDSSYKRGKPFQLELGAGMVIAGWEQGLQGICKGEKRLLTIPYELAYGAAGYPPTIPPKATLKFEVELVDFADGSEDL